MLKTLALKPLPAEMPTDARKRVDAEFAQEQGGGGGGVGDEFGFVAEAAEEDGDDEGSAGEAEFHAEADVDGAEDDAEDDADEDGDEVGLVEAFHGVAESRGEAFDVGGVSDDGESVAHLEAE